MTLDHPLTRNQTICPFCSEHKSIGLVACWPCFRSSGLKNGDESANNILDNFEGFVEILNGRKENANKLLDVFEDFVEILNGKAAS